VARQSGASWRTKAERRHKVTGDGAKIKWEDSIFCTHARGAGGVTRSARGRAQRQAREDLEKCLGKSEKISSLQTRRREISESPSGISLYRKMTWATAEHRL